MIKTLLKLTLCAIMLTAAGFCQNLTGSQITDETAAELWMYSMTQLNPTSLVGDTLANNAGLTGADANAALTAINTFNTQYQNAIANYNASTAGVTDGPTMSSLYVSFLSARATVTNNAITLLQNSLSSQGYSTLHGYVLSQKINMSLDPSYYQNPPFPTCQHTGLSTVDNVILTQTQNPTDPQETISVTTSGVALCPGVTTAESTAKITGVGSKTVPATGNAGQFITATADLVVYSPIDECYEGSWGVCEDASDASGSGGDGGSYAWNNSQTYREIAFTMTLNTGRYTYCGGASCDWIVADWCTPDTMPPDKEMQGEAIWWTKTGLPGYWLVVAACSTSYTDKYGHPMQPYNCTYGWAVPKGNTQRYYACTSHVAPI